MADDEPTTTPKRPRARRKPAVAANAAAPGPTNGAIHGAISPVLAGAAEPTGEPGFGQPIVSEDGASLEADHIQMQFSAVGRVEATELSVAQGAVGAARAEHLTVERGAIGAAMADRVEVSRSYIRSVLSRQVQFDRSAARVVIAADVNAQQTAVMFLIARRVAGEVRVLFDWRGALAFGAGAGFVFALLSRLRRRPR